MSMALTYLQTSCGHISQVLVHGFSLVCLIGCILNWNGGNQWNSTSRAASHCFFWIFSDSASVTVLAQPLAAFLSSIFFLTFFNGVDRGEEREWEASETPGCSPTFQRRCLPGGVVRLGAEAARLRVGEEGTARAKALQGKTLEKPSSLGLSASVLKMWEIEWEKERDKDDILLMLLLLRAVEWMDKKIVLSLSVLGTKGWVLITFTERTLYSIQIESNEIGKENFQNRI